MNITDEQRVSKKKKQSLGVLKNYKDLEHVVEQFSEGSIIKPKDVGLILNNRKLFYNWAKKCKNLKKIGRNYIKVKYEEENETTN